MNMIDLWDINNLDQAKKEAFPLKCIEGLDEITQSNERIICNGSDNELGSNNNNESSTRSRDHIEDIFQPYKDQEKQKTDRPMLFKTKHANEESVGKDINNIKGNSKEPNKSINKAEILTREQEIKIQKEKHKPTIRNKYKTMNMIDLWDSNNLDQEKKEAFQLKCIGIKRKIP